MILWWKENYVTLADIVAELLKNSMTRAVLYYASLCCCSVAKSCLTLCNPVDCSKPGFLSFTVSRSLLKLMSIEFVILSNHLICCSLLLLSSVFPSIRAFFTESALCIIWPKYWEFQVQHKSFSEYSGLISFRIDWFDLLAVQGTLRSLLQHHNLKASVFQHSASLWSNSHICT